MLSVPVFGLSLPAAVVTEGEDAYVEVCVVVINGTPTSDVTFAFSTQSGTAQGCTLVK